MANTSFTVPVLREKDAFIDARGWDSGGYGWYGDTPLANIRAVAIHHSVTPDRGNGEQEVREIIRMHRNGRGWGGVGYNIIVTSEEVADGEFTKAFYVGDLGSIRAHTPNRKGAHGIPAMLGNQHILSILVIGSFHDGRGIPSGAKLRTTNAIASELIFNEDRRLPNLFNDWNRSLFGHKDFDYTACPGDFHLFRDQIINPPQHREPTPPPVRWQDADFRQDPQVFVVKGESIATKNFDTGEVTGLLPKGRRVETVATSNDDRWYVTQWSLDNNVRHGFLIEDVLADQAIEEPEETPEAIEQPDYDPVKPEEAPEMPEVPVVVVPQVPEPKEETTATKDVAKTVGKYLGPSGAVTVATLTAWQQWLAQVPSYVWIVLLVMLNVFLIVLYSKSPKFNAAVDRMVESVLKKLNIK